MYEVYLLKYNYMYHAYTTLKGLKRQIFYIFKFNFIVMKITISGKAIYYKSVMFIMLLFITGSVYSQSKLELKVKKAQEKYDAAEAIVNFGDSLIVVGKEMISAGKKDYKDLNGEKKTKEKQYKTDLKLLNKELKTDDKDEKNVVKGKIRELNKKNKTELRDIDKKIKAAIRKIENGDKYVAKGKAKQKAGKTKLKSSEKALKAAKKALEKS